MVGIDKRMIRGRGGERQREKAGLDRETEGGKRWRVDRKITKETEMQAARQSAWTRHGNRKTRGDRNQTRDT